MARFATFTVGSQVIVLPEGPEVHGPDIAREQLHRHARHDKLKKLRMLPSELCTTRTFLRRVYLDIIGLLPTPEEYDRFMAETRPNKREKLVDELLGRKEFAELWVMKWAELLQIRSSTTRSATRRCCSTTTGCRTRSPRTCRRPDGCRSCSAPTAARSRTRRRTTTRSRPTP